MQKRHRIPYRGEPLPKYPKPRRQFRNLLKERAENTKTILSIFVFLSLIGIALVLSTSLAVNPKVIIGFFIILFIVGFFFSVMISDGLQNINKFRKGYDFDSSVLEENEEEKKIESF